MSDVGRFYPHLIRLVTFDAFMSYLIWSLSTVDTEKLYNGCDYNFNEICIIETVGLHLFIVSKFANTYGSAWRVD